MEKISVLAITKNGINIGQKLKESFPNWKVFAPSKFSNNDNAITWYSESTSDKIVELFKNNDALICLFSLGAVIRLISPHLIDKKTDPAVIVIDDKMNFVISVLSGHIGGANELTKEIAKKLQAQAVITTAADVNKTIAVDLVGKEYGWRIEDDSNVTKISADMVNEEPIGLLQEVGTKNWCKQLPKNVSIFETIEELEKSNSKSNLIISDRVIGKDLASKSVIYRPPSLVIGIGLHWDTSKETIKEGIENCFENFSLSSKSIAKLVSIKKPQDVQGLIDIGKEMEIPVEYVRQRRFSSSYSSQSI